MSDDAGFSVIGGARAAVRFVVSGAPATLVAAAVFAAAAVAGGEFGRWAAGGPGPLAFLCGLPITAAGAASFAAAVLRRHADGPGGRWSPGFGVMELRVAAMLLLVGFVLLFILLLGTFAVALVTSAFLTAVRADLGTDLLDFREMLSIIGPFGRVAFWLTVVGTLGVTGYTGARLATAPAATYAERKLQIFATWERTAGRAGPIALAVGLAAIPGVAASALTRFGAAAALGAAPPPALDLIARAAVGFVDAAVLGVALVALSAYVYGHAVRPAAPADADDGDAP